MDALIWLIIAVAIVVVAALAFVLIRHRQRSGDVVASRPVVGETRSS